MCCWSVKLDVVQTFWNLCRGCGKGAGVLKKGAGSRISRAFFGGQKSEIFDFTFVLVVLPYVWAVGRKGAGGCRKGAGSRASRAFCGGQKSGIYEFTLVLVVFTLKRVWGRTLLFLYY